MSTLSDAPVPYGTPRGKPAGCDFGGELGSVTGLPDTTRKRAMRAVASRADGVEDARVLLEHLGLIDPSTPSPAWRRANKPKGVPA